jgi:hypothetical protein
VVSIRMRVIRKPEKRRKGPHQPSHTEVRSSMPQIPKKLRVTEKHKKNCDPANPVEFRDCFGQAPKQFPLWDTTL